MGQDSKIEWTTHTFNPWIGCTKVSDGCKNCYAEVYDRRVRGLHGKKPRRWGPSAARERTAPSYWKQPLKWNEEAKRTGTRARVFCASLADVFDEHPSIDPNWRLELFDLIRRTPHLDWLLLTKRPENIVRLVGEAMCTVRSENGDFDTTLAWLTEWFWGPNPAGNVWLGTTVENREQAKLRIPELLKVAAHVRFLSCEPLLEHVELREWIPHAPRMAAGHCLYCGNVPGHILHNSAIAGIGWTSIDWVIVGGESGHGARPFDVQWARDIREQCAGGDVPCFVKQLGANAVAALPGSLVSLAFPTEDPKGGEWLEWPEDLRIRQFPEARP